MSKPKKNGDQAVGDQTSAFGSTIVDRKRPQPRMVIDPFTNERRPENKQERFRRLAEQRVTVACRRISLVCSLGNRNQYEYTEDDANKILSALQESVNTVRSAFSGKRPAVQGFKL